jgi:CxxC motif-containing protein (DUF1111 family)
MRCLAFLLLLCACPSSAPEPTPRAPLGPRSVWGDEVGGPIRGLDDDQLAAFGRGRALMERVFKPSEGLGPTYNADGCVSCHEVPALGGTAGRQRDVFLAQRTDGDQREDLGTDPGGPLRKLFSTEEGHTPEPPGATSYARRSPTPFFGVGLFTFVDVDAVLAREDPEDADGDGISGRAHRVDGQLGRFGYKAQAATVEDAVRAALREQMGVTSPEVGWTPKELAAARPTQSCRRATSRTWSRS